MRKINRSVTIILALVMAFQLVGFNTGAVYANLPVTNEFINSTTGPSQTEPSQTEPSQIEPSQTGPSQTGPSQTRPSQTELSQTGQASDIQSHMSENSPGLRAEAYGN